MKWLAVNSTSCNGTLSADVMVSSAAGDEKLYGAAGNDTYVASEGGDFYIDESTSNDLYGGFLNGEFFNPAIDDKGGVDRVDLSMSTSAYASTDFQFFKRDVDSDGAKDDLRIDEKNLSGLNGDDDLYVLSHFGAGRIEYIKFTDKTLSGANLPLSP